MAYALDGTYLTSDYDEGADILYLWVAFSGSSERNAARRRCAPRSSSVPSAASSSRRTPADKPAEALLAPSARVDS